MASPAVAEASILCATTAASSVQGTPVPPPNVPPGMPTFHGQVPDWSRIGGEGGNASGGIDPGSEAAKLKAPYLVT